MKKLILFYDFFFPGYKAGGPIQSCINFLMAMKEDYELYVITSDTDLGEVRPYQNIESNKWIRPLHPSIAVYYFSHENLTYKNIKKLIIDIDPQFIYINHIYSLKFVQMPLWIWKKNKLNSKLVLCPRGALFSSALHYRNTYFKKIVYLKIFKWLGLHKRIYFHATNEREKEAIEEYFPGSHIAVVNNLPKSQKQDFFAVDKTSGELKCIFIARIVPIKNLLYLLQVLKEVKGKILLTIVGPAEDEVYFAKCKEFIEGLPGNISVVYNGPETNEEIESKLKEHHLFVLPTAGENFGHSIFESLLAGRPVLISDQTPWKNLQEYKAGWDLPLTQNESFKQVLEMVINWDNEEYQSWAKGAWQFASNFNQHSDDVKKYKQLFS